MSADALSVVAVARVVAAAARDTPGVAHLHRGIVGEVATYGDGDKVEGVRVHSKPTRRATVHLVARYGRPLDELGDDVRARVEQALEEVLPEAPRMPVDVHIVDVRVEEGALPEQTGPEQTGPERTGPGQTDLGRTDPARGAAGEGPDRGTAP